MRSKIFGIGLPRTGTQSLTVAMSRLGYVSGHCLSPSQWSKMDNFDFVCDSPVPSRFMELDRTYPKSKYIFTTRGIDAWLASCETFFKEKRPPGLIKEKWLLEYRKEIFGTTKYDPILFEETYYKHTERIRKHFFENSSSLLTLDITNGEGWEKLVDFLGLSIELKELGPFPNNDFIKRLKTNRLRGEKKVPAFNILQNSISTERPEVVSFQIFPKEAGPVPTENVKQVIFFLNKFNGLIAENKPLKDEVGLLNGKIGLSIYFFMLAKKTKNTYFQSIAENLIGDVYDSAGNFSIPTDFENGLSGIAWGLCYLVKNNYLDAKIDEILEDADDSIYRYWNESREKLPLDLKQGLLGYLSYYTYRLEISQDPGDSVNRYIHTRVASEIINRIGQLVEEEKFQTREPALFTLFWEIPLLLILLANSKQLQINSNKINRILDFLTPIITSLYPRLHSNRIYLLLGLESVLKEVSLSALRSHADLLSENISLSRVIEEECKNLNILAMDGITGLAYISIHLAALTGSTDLLFPKEEVIQKISKSVLWEEIGYYQEMKKNIGLSTGVSGIGMLFLEYLIINHFVIQS